MIDVNMLPRELTGYVGHVCGLWFGSYFIDFEPVFVHSTAGIIGELYEYLVDTVQDNSMNGGLDYEDAEEYAKLAATVPWSMEEIDRVAEQSFRYVSDRTLQVAYALCVLTFDAMFPQKIEVVKPDVRETLLSVAFPHDWQRRMAESDHDRVSVYRMGLECVTKAYDKVFDRYGDADVRAIIRYRDVFSWRLMQYAVFVIGHGICVDDFQDHAIHDVLPCGYQLWRITYALRFCLVCAFVVESEFYQLVYNGGCFLGEVEYRHCVSFCDSS